MRKSYRDELVIITGGASGIGLALAKLYQEAGAVLAILDLDRAAMTAAGRELPAAHFFPCDVSRRDEVYEAAERIRRRIGLPPALLVNNAGVVENSRLLDCPDELLERTLRVNVLAHFWTLKAFLPAMIDRGFGHVCQIASAAGLVGVPGLVAYCASKHAVVGLSEALRLELRQLAGDAVGMTLVCPGFVDTALFEGARPALFTPILEQDRLARLIFRGVDRDRELVLEPLMVRSIPFLKAYLGPRQLDRVLGWFGVTRAMDDILAG